MKADDPVVLDIMRPVHGRPHRHPFPHGRPSINPLYFVYLNGHIWLGTASSLLVVATEVSKTHSSGSMPVFRLGFPHPDHPNNQGTPSDDAGWSTVLWFGSECPTKQIILALPQLDYA